MSNNIQSETESAVSCLCKDDVCSQVNASLRFYRHKNCTKNTINVRNIWNFIQNNSTFLCPLSYVYPSLVSDLWYLLYEECDARHILGWGPQFINPPIVTLNTFNLAFHYKSLFELRDGGGGRGGFGIYRLLWLCHVLAGVPKIRYRCHKI